MPLFNGFVDSISCIGFSSRNGIRLDAESKGDISFVLKRFQPSLLLVIDGDRAIHLQNENSTVVDPNYPFFKDFETNSSSKISSHHGTPSTSSVVMRRPNKQITISAMHKNLPMFCFPDHVKPTFLAEPPKIHQVVLTQEEGKRSFALILTVQQKFLLRSENSTNEEILQVEDVPKFTVNRSGQTASSKIPVQSSGGHRSRKMPISYQHDSSKASETQKQSNYASPTYSSEMKRISATASEPVSRISRRSSFSNNRNPGDSSIRSSSATRQRSESRSSLNRQTATKTASNDITRPFFLPHCIVLISNFPYWTAMREVLSMIDDEIDHGQIELYSDSYKKLIQKISFLACNTPVPPVPWERFSLSFNIAYHHSILTLDPPISIDRSVVDLDVSALILTLNPRKLLQVLSAILTEQPIMFFSSHYSTLVTIVECILTLIYPFKWLHVYIPIVPDALRDYYEAGLPGCYIMGTHSNHQKRVEELDICLTCNLDNDQNIFIPSTMKLDLIPESRNKNFIKSIAEEVNQIKGHRAMQKLDAPLTHRMDKLREDEQRSRTETNKRIIDHFLKLMIDLVGDIFDPIYWKFSQAVASPRNSLERKTNGDLRNSAQKAIFFSREQYLQTKKEGPEKEFYSSLTQTTAFQALLESESIPTKSMTEFRRICKSQQVAHELRLNSTISDQMSDDENGDPDEFEATPGLSETMVLKLPDWPKNISNHYLDRCIDIFTQELENNNTERSTALVTILHYLRGCALLARGQLIAGLKDLYMVENETYFPRDYIQTKIVPELSSSLLLNTFLNEPFYRTAAEWKKVRKSTVRTTVSFIELNEGGEGLDKSRPLEQTTNSDLDEEYGFIDKNLNVDQFSQLVHRFGIAVDKEATVNLFKALLHWVSWPTSKATPKKEAKKSFDNKKQSKQSSSSTGRFNESTNQTEESVQSSSPNRDSVGAHEQSIPGALFSAFLEAWQQIKIEMIKMNHYLPNDRKDKESVLKVSLPGVVARKDGLGRLLLTQKRLYFLPDTRAQPLLLADIDTVILLEKSVDSSPVTSRNSIKLTCHPTSTHSSLKRNSGSPNSSLQHHASSPVQNKSLAMENEIKSVFTIRFRTHQEQEHWCAVLDEMRSGAIIAHAEYDISLLNRASLNVVFITALSALNFSGELKIKPDTSVTEIGLKERQQFNEACLKAAINDIATFTRTRIDGSFKVVPTKTGHSIARRLSPSTNETEVHEIRCLAFAEHPDGDERASLWCAYGSKLKIFNYPSWFTDGRDIVFPANINSMCLDNRYKLWVGCIDGKLFVVDTISRIRGESLAVIEGENGIQSIVFDPNQETMLVATKKSLVIRWNVGNWKSFDEFNIYEIYRDTHELRLRNFVSEAKFVLNNLKVLPTPAPQRLNSSNPKSSEISFSGGQVNSSQNSSPHIVPSSNDKLKQIQVYEDFLIACYEFDYILVLRISESENYLFEYLVPIKYRHGELTPIDAFVVYKKKLWTSTQNIVSIYNIEKQNNAHTFTLELKFPIEDDFLSTMTGFSDYILAGSVRGKIYLVDTQKYNIQKVLDGHRDQISCFTTLFDGCIVSGSGASDRRVTIWDDLRSS